MNETELQAYFDGVIAADGRIEPRDWMPEGYRKTLIRQIAQHAHSEIIGMQPEGNWLTRAPSLKRKAHPHGQGPGRGRPRPVPLQRRPRRSGSSRDELLDLLHTGKQKYSSIFNYPTLTWADVGAIGWLVDGAAITNQVPLCRCSYGPYARAMVRICKEESFHQRQGFEILHTLSHGTPAQHAMAQDAVNRWWWPSLMMFGPARHRLAPLGPVDGLADQAPLQRRAPADGSSTCACPRPRSSASTLPDPAAALERPSAATTTSAPSTGRSSSAVVRGDGPCNRQRMEHKIAAHDEGAWVREAALAYAAQAAGRAAPGRSAA